VKPSPAFMARLRQTEIEAPQKQASGIADWFGGLWQNHRQALAAGVAACVVLALAISIPMTLTRNGGEPQLIAKEDGRMAATQAPSLESGEPALKMAGPEEMAVPAPTPMPMPATEQDWVSGTYNVAEENDGSTPPLPTTPPGTFAMTVSGTGFAPSEEMILGQEKQLAVWIAFADAGVKAALQGKTLIALDMQQGIEIEDFSCPGWAVVLTLEEEDSSITSLYICVDIEVREVAQMVSLAQ